MATLSNTVKDALTCAVVKALSSMWEPIYVSHQAVREAIDIMDLQLESTEVDVLSNVPTATCDWFKDHPKISREILAQVEKKRKEHL